MIIPIPWYSADIRLKKLDIRVKPRRQVSKFHADGHGVSRILFLIFQFNRFFYFLRIISVPWYSAVIRVKKLWHLCESLSTCKLTRIVAEHHGFLFLVCQFNGISQISQDYICSVILRDYPCEKTRTSVWRSLRHVRAICRLVCLHVSLERALHLVKLIHQSMIWVSFL